MPKRLPIHNYTAKISRNLRDVATGSPKVLLRSIQTETEDFRDHCWVEINEELQKILTTPHTMRNKSYIISFDAKEKRYTKRGETQITLAGVQNVQIIGKA